MTKKLKIRLFSLAFLILSAIVLLTQTPESSDSPKQNAVTEQDILQVKLTDNGVVLIRNEEILKVYDIQPSILPGEDILLLREGISVDSESEADSLAENFDG